MPSGFPRFFREMPGFAPVAPIGAEFHWRVGGGDLVFSRGEGSAFRGVFAFAADRAFGGVIHREPSGNSHHQLMRAKRAMAGTSYNEMPLAPTMADSVGCKNGV
jgi:hypothetical protein